METLEITLHKFQDKAIFSDKRFVALVAGLQSGKTIAGAIWARKEFDEFPKDSGLICAPTYKILTQSTLPKFFEINKDLKRYYKKGDSEIVIPGRGTIFIRSTENPNVIEGMTLRWCWADEAGQMKVDAWINLQGRLSILKGKLFCTTTPYTLNWLYTDFYEQWKKGNSDYDVIQFRSCDNPYFPKEEYERVKKTMDSRVFRRRYDGLFEKMEGLVYEDFIPSVHLITPREIRFKEIICGIDWAFSHAAAIAVIGIDNENKYYLIDEYYKSGKITAELINVLKTFKQKYNIRFWYPDPAEPDRIEEMKRAGLFPQEVSKGDGSIKKGIDDVRKLIKEGRFYAFDTCVHFQDEVMTYHYPEEGIKDLPVKEQDDMMDAIRYPIMTYILEATDFREQQRILNNRQQANQFR